MAGDEATDTLAGRLLAMYQNHYAREGRAAELLSMEIDERDFDDLIDMARAAEAENARLRAERDAEEELRRQQHRAHHTVMDSQQREIVALRAALAAHAAPWQYPDPASAAWRAEYDAAVARRDWQTAAQMLDERAARECPPEATTATQGDGRAVEDVG